MTEDKIQPQGKTLTQTELDAIADITYQDLKLASDSFDETNPRYRGLLRCRQLPRQF